MRTYLDADLSGILLIQQWHWIRNFSRYCLRLDIISVMEIMKAVLNIIVLLTHSEENLCLLNCHIIFELINYCIFADLTVIQ